MIDTLAMAIYRTVHDYRPADPDAPRGAVGLGPITGIKPGTLNNKADPAHDSELTVREAVPVMRATENYSILATLAAELQHATIPLGNYRQCSDTEVLDLYCQYHADLGDTAEAIRTVIAAGGHISADKVAEVKREMVEDIQAAFALLSRLEALAGVER